MSNGNGGSKRKQRSPAHPSVALEEAIQRARELYEAEGTVQVPVKVAIQDWGYSPKSSTGIRLIAALRHYGLLDEEGSGDNRKVALSDLATKILRSPDESERKQAKRMAALNPNVFWKLYEENDGELPSRENLEYMLEFELGFNPKKLTDVVDDYIDTIKFADLDGVAFGLDIEGDAEGDTAPGKDGPEGDGGAGKPSTEGESMPAVDARPEQKPWDWTIPLTGGKQAVLRVPRPLSEEDFDHLDDMLTDFFKKQKPMLTSERSRNGSRNEAEDEPS